ncbi:MAG: PDZ domain-containing protein [Planctomycetia bacterium]
MRRPPPADRALPGHVAPAPKAAARPLLLLALLAGLLLAPGRARPCTAGEPATHGLAELSRFGAGEGPAAIPGGWRLLDTQGTPRQSNAVALPGVTPGASARVRLEATLRIGSAGDGACLLLLPTARFGARGPAPFLASWVEPNLPGTFAVAFDVHNPPSKEMFTAFGNYEDKPQREVSLHWDGRERAKRVAPVEFRGEAVPVVVTLEQAPGGSEASVTLAGATVFERFFLHGLHPYELRLAMGAGTRDDAGKEPRAQAEVTGVVLAQEQPAAPVRPPLAVEVFHHVRTDGTVQAHQRTVDLPPAGWAFGRVVLTLDLHDAGEAWDEWDRNGEISLVEPDGTRLGLVPFITSYRTPCHWEVDVTHFRPLLVGRRTLEIAAGTSFYKGRGYLMSVRLDFHHGTPALWPSRVTPLWQGTAHYRSHANHFQDFYDTRTLATQDCAVATRLWMATTGHSQVGEFTPALRTLVVQAGGQEHEVPHRLWKDDCYLNPNRPQYGTWQFARAGWAPGDVVAPWWVDLTPWVTPAQPFTLALRTQPYAFPAGEEAPSEAQCAEATHVVRAYLIEYATPAGCVAAPSLRILDVSADGLAAAAGLKAGDWLASYDGVTIDTVEELRAAIAAAQGKERVAVVVFRGLERVEATLPPGRMGISLSGR